MIFLKTVDILQLRLPTVLKLHQNQHQLQYIENYGSTVVVLGYNSTYFSNNIQEGKTCYSEEQVISMLEFLIDNIFVYSVPPQETNM